MPNRHYKANRATLAAIAAGLPGEVRLTLTSFGKKEEFVRKSKVMPNRHYKANRANSDDMGM